MKKTVIVLANVALALFCATTFAADNAGKFAVRGMGSTACKQLTAAVDSKDQNLRKDAVLLYTDWLNGYMSYANRTEKNTYDIVPVADSAVVLAVAVTQCRNNPDVLFETMASQVIGALSKARVSAESPLVDLIVGDNKGSFRKATLMSIQTKLIAMGFHKGKADGDFGSSSQQALKAFQKSEKLKETGFPDADTLMRVLLK